MRFPLPAGLSAHRRSALLLLGAAISCIICVNIFLPFPDINDFQGLARVCLLMDDDIKYCVNNNWGFAHPLSCWLLTKVTGDLLVSQRLLNALFFAGYIVLLLRMMHRLARVPNGRYAWCLLLFICSPWFLDAILSMHLDIIPISLMFAAVSIVISQKSGTAFFAAGVLAGASYWFRFHFLPMSLLFPILTFALVNDCRRRGILLSAAGVLIAVALPHFLCMLAYGAFMFSNEQFVLAYALGAVDWTYESAERFSQMTTAEMFRTFDPLRFALSYGHQFLTSGISVLLLIAGIALVNYFRATRTTLRELITGSSHLRSMLLIALWAGITMIPFTVLRGFTLRLESAFVFFVLPLVIATIADVPKKAASVALVLLLAGITFQQALFWHGLYVTKTTTAAIERSVLRTIPETVLRNRPGSIINCVLFHNPYNKYRLCNPTVSAGWGVRFDPFIKKFGLLILADPLGSDIYKQAEYLILPTHPDTDVFKISGGLYSRNRMLYEDEYVTILQKEPGS